MKPKWWRLEVDGNLGDLNEADREHIAKEIKEGYIEGEICE